MNKWRYLFILLLFFCVFYKFPLFSQELDKELNIPKLAEEPVSSESERGELHFFLNNVLLFPISVSEGGLGLGVTGTVQYTTAFNLSFGIESGYYGFKSEAETKEDRYISVGGFSIIPILAHASYNLKLIDGLYLTPVIKIGVGYTTAKINGWNGDSNFSTMFEGGVRLKAIVAGALLIQANINYTGMIEKSGIFSIMSLGFGLGF